MEDHSVRCLTHKPYGRQKLTLYQKTESTSDTSLSELDMLTPSEKVFGLPELFEQILLNVSIADMMRAPRVNRH